MVCTDTHISVQSVRRTHSAVTTRDFGRAVQARFGVSADFNFQQSGLTSFSLPQQLPPEGDDPMGSAEERLMDLMSLFQALNIDLAIMAVPIKAVKTNSEGEALPLQDWLAYTFSAETDISPQQIFAGDRYTGLRLSDITVALNSSDGSLRYKISGVLYGKR